MSEENKSIEEVLESYFPILRDPELIEEIKSVAKLETVEEGEILIDLDEPIRFLPLIYKGLIKVNREDDDGRELLLYYLETGNTCASSLTCCMDSKVSSIRAEAEEYSEFISIPVDKIDQWIAKYPSWKEFIMTTYAMRFEELLNTVDELAFNKLDERLVHYLKNKSKVTGSNELKVSHRQIAYDLNSSREVISRLLKQLERMGEIELGRGKIVIPS